MKTAVVLHNMGGPVCRPEVRQFLFNLFNDRAMTNLPAIPRAIFAFALSAARTNYATKEYDKIGGKSPLLENTNRLAGLLNAAVNNPEIKCFIAMRYSQPLISDAVRMIMEWAPDEVIQLPLYPQFSHTTTGSSFNEFRRVFKGRCPVKEIKSYPDEESFVTALADNIIEKYNEAKKYGTPRLIFSAHGLPEKMVHNGDPYQDECERTAAAVRKKLAAQDIDGILCYQSRVGPLKWIGPHTKDEIMRAGTEGKPIVIAPISFVSENLETVVELGINYRNLARECGAPFFAVSNTPDTKPGFINGLAKQIVDLID